MAGVAKKGGVATSAAKAASSTREPLLSQGPPLYMRRLFDDPSMNDAVFASPERPSLC